MIKDLKNFQVERPYLKEVDSCSLRCSLFNLDDAFMTLLKDGIKDKENILSLRENTTLKEVIEQTV